MHVIYPLDLKIAKIIFSKQRNKSTVLSKVLFLISLSNRTLLIYYSFLCDFVAFNVAKFLAIVCEIVLMQKRVQETETIRH